MKENHMNYSIEKNSSMTNTKISDESREFRELNKEIFTRIQQEGNNSVVSGASQNNNTNGSMNSILDTKWEKNVTPDTSEIFQKKVYVFNESAAKNKKHKHTLIHNPTPSSNAKDNKGNTDGYGNNGNSTAENEDAITDIPNSDETINQLHVQLCKNNNLSEIDLNQLNQNINALSITSSISANTAMTNSMPNITQVNRSINPINMNSNGSIMKPNDNYYHPSLVMVQQDNPNQMMKNTYPARQWQQNYQCQDLLPNLTHNNNANTYNNDSEYNNPKYNEIAFTKANQPYSNHNYNYIPKNQNYPPYNQYYNYYLNTNRQMQLQPQPQYDNTTTKKMIYPKPNANPNCNINMNINQNINDLYTQSMPNIPNMPNAPYNPKSINQMNPLYTEQAFTYNTEQFEQKKKKKLKERLDQTLFTINIDQLLQGTDIRTTIMIRHIPNKYSAQNLLEEIEVACKNKYDFFYLPIDAENQCNLGYSFINFLSPLHIIYFFRMFKSRKWNHYKSHKECDLTFAKFQGKVELTAHLEKNTHKIDESKKPMLFNPPNPLPKIDLPIEYRDLINETRPELIPQINFK